jgi:hypothetical protein
MAKLGIQQLPSSCVERVVLSNEVAFMADCALPLLDPLEGESNGSCLRRSRHLMRGTGARSSKEL